MNPEVPPENTPSDQLRLFTALALPDNARRQIEDLLTRLRKGATFTGAHPTWVAPENVHITLVFLGSQPAGRVDEICAAADEAARSLPPFELSLEGLHLFPNPKEPRIISLEIAGAVGQLKRLHESLAGELRGRGFPVESRPFRPHITLARIKSMRGLPGLRQLVASHQRLSAIALPVDRITLYQSTLTSAGPVYEVRHEALLTRSE